MSAIIHVAIGIVVGGVLGLVAGALIGFKLERRYSRWRTDTPPYR